MQRKHAGTRKDLWTMNPCDEFCNYATNESPSAKMIRWYMVRLDRSSDKLVSKIRLNSARFHSARAEREEATLKMTELIKTEPSGWQLANGSGEILAESHQSHRTARKPVMSESESENFEIDKVDVA
jgi:hypothetical protein